MKCKECRNYVGGICYDAGWPVGPEKVCDMWSEEEQNTYHLKKEEA